jgi:hypothetical protein
MTTIMDSTHMKDLFTVIIVDDSDSDSDDEDDDDWKCEHCHLVFNQEFGSMSHYRFCNVLNKPKK